MIERRHSRLILRRIGAVLAGLLTVIVLSTLTDALLHTTGVFPRLGEPMFNSLFLLTTIYRTLYGVAGGYITAQLAPDRPAHALTLGVLGACHQSCRYCSDLECRSGFWSQMVPLRDRRHCTAECLAR